MKKVALLLVVIASLVVASVASAHHGPAKPKKHPKPPAPPVVVVPVFSGDPDRTGFCDINGKFWDLVVGQDQVEPWTVLQLRPANVGLPGNPAAIWC